MKIHLSFLLVIFSILPYEIKAYSTHEKFFIAVMDLNGSNILTEGETSVITNQLRNILVKSDKFVVLDRYNMEKILEEQKLKLGNMTSDPSIRVNIGQILGVEKIVTGSIGKLGNTFQIVVYLTDVTTGKIERTAEEQFIGEIDGLLDIVKKIGLALSEGQVQEISPAIKSEDKKIEQNMEEFKRESQQKDIQKVAVESAPSLQAEEKNVLNSKINSKDSIQEEGKAKERIIENSQEVGLKTSFQASLVDNIQLYPKDYNIDGVRFTLFASNNNNVKWADFSLVLSGSENFLGFQFSFIVNYIRNNFLGVQYALIGNVVKNQATGLQFAHVFNYAGETVKGAQFSIFNYAKELLGFQTGIINIVKAGNINFTRSFKYPEKLENLSAVDEKLEKKLNYFFQFGIVNSASKINGFQLGLINYAEKMVGFQIGLINIISTKEIPLLPIFNYSNNF